MWHMPHAAKRLTRRVPKTNKWAEADKYCAYCGTKIDVQCHDAKQCQARDPQGFPGAAATTRVLHELLGGGGHGQQPFCDLLDFSWRGQPLQYTYRVGVRLPLTLFSKKCDARSIAFQGLSNEASENFEKHGISGLERKIKRMRS